ncbi:MAG: inorganic diphosphatase [Gammaproteobacteria bacterium]
MLQLIKKWAENDTQCRLDRIRPGASIERPAATPQGAAGGLRSLVFIGLAAFLSACSEPANLPAAEQASVRLEGERHYVSGYPARAESGLVNMVVEIPAGTQAKWEVNKSQGSLDWERQDGAYRVVQYLPYVGNYGMLPRTLLPKSLGGDGDPLDILLLGAALPRGTVLAVRPVGVLRLLDRGEQDDKIIAVPTAGPMHEVDDIDTLREHYAGVSEIVEQWFAGYKGPGQMESLGYADRAAALQMIEQASAAYEAEHGK